MKLLFRLFEDIFQSSRQGNSLTKIDSFLMNTRFPGFIEAIIKTIVCNYEDKEEPHYAEMHDNTKCHHRYQLDNVQKGILLIVIVSHLCLQFVNISISYMILTQAIQLT